MFLIHDAERRQAEPERRRLDAVLRSRSVPSVEPCEIEDVLSDGALRHPGPLIGEQSRTHVPYELYDHLSVLPGRAASQPPAGANIVFGMDCRCETDRGRSAFLVVVVAGADFRFDLDRDGFGNARQQDVENSGSLRIEHVLSAVVVAAAVNARIVF